ncbi:DUF969 domain-containing protein [Novosphingobium sp. BL-8H]|uniref:DUF969 domain-containing protein n=1 Tax=Novosphingobium sp. BL-8H TaxID=3127640 RepID=UPI0037577525
MIEYWPLAGILVVIAGFALRFNPLLVVAAAALVTGLLGHMGVVQVISLLGKGFNDNRFVTVVYIVLPVIGLLERFGLQQRARTMIENMRGATVGRLLIAYLAFRQIMAALGLTSVAGHAQTVRPLVAPMAEAAARKQDPNGTEDDIEAVKAMAAATDNVGVFFGEDVFIAIGSILLIQGVLKADGIDIAPIHLSLWAIPTAICAFAIHAFRLWRFDRRLRAAEGPAA